MPIVHRGATMAGVAAGKQLRTDLDAQLARASADSGKALAWTEVELVVIARACKAADRAEVLEGLWDAEAAGKRDPAKLTRLAAELRLTDKHLIVLTERLKLTAEPTKSLRHQKAAYAMHARPRPVA